MRYLVTYETKSTRAEDSRRPSATKTTVMCGPICVWYRELSNACKENHETLIVHMAELMLDSNGKMTETYP